MNEERRTAFIKAAIWHGSLEEAEQLLAAHPELATCDIHTAAITAQVDAVREFLADDPANATAVSEPYGGNALVYLCLSIYLQQDKTRSDDFMQAAQALLEGGADPNAGFTVEGPYPGYETPLYGAAGVAHHAGLTELLLAYGANPNDEEAVYHSPETYDNEAMQLLVATGKLTQENLSMMLIRKLDWHDYHGLQYLLDHGADPNGERKRGWHALHHSLKRANGLPFVALLLERGADPLLASNGFTPVMMAACEGRNDVLELFAQKGIAVQLEGVYQLIAACAMDDPEAIEKIVRASPSLVSQVLAMGGELLARFSVCGNAAGVQQLLNLGIPADAPYRAGDGYYDIPIGSLAIHIAAWRGYPEVVQVFIAAGSPVDVPDKNGQTPLALAIKACVDSYWTERRSPDAVKALLAAGASANTISYPCGYDAVDALLAAARK
ncbi:ankyrin repeat domain-containing protein [Longitalea luteola]|uniref:ankyrin repeat domain-containing protein n=1 Tax=Longitalea luteola TaxID=2812563 RepID=UPI001A971215|nr:ankyrin repeat domain-containing protein [Longitalea luteola]